MSEMDRDFWNDSYKEDPDQVIVPDYLLQAEVANLTVGTAVDLGCGSGHNVLMLAGLGWQATGVDWAAEAVRLAKEAAQAIGVTAQFIVADTTSWEPAQRYDLVISTYALPGGKSSQQVLETAVRALAAGGTIIIIEWDKSMAEPWQFAENDLMSPSEISALMTGLTIEKAEVRQVENPHREFDPTNAFANVALVRAKKQN